MNTTEEKERQRVQMRKNIMRVYPQFPPPPENASVETLMRMNLEYNYKVHNPNVSVDTSKIEAQRIIDEDKEKRRSVEEKVKGGEEFVSWAVIGPYARLTFMQDTVNPLSLDYDERGVNVPLKVRQTGDGPAGKIEGLTFRSWSSFGSEAELRYIAGNGYPISRDGIYWPSAGVVLPKKDYTEEEEYSLTNFLNGFFSGDPATIIDRALRTGMWSLNLLPKNLQPKAIINETVELEKKAEEFAKKKLAELEESLEKSKWYLLAFGGIASVAILGGTAVAIKREFK